MAYIITFYTVLFIIACLEFLVKDEDRVELGPLPENDEWELYEEC